MVRKNEAIIKMRPDKKDNSSQVSGAGKNRKIKIERVLQRKTQEVKIKWMNHQKDESRNNLNK